MQVLTPHLDRQGRISYRYDDKATQYLCGMRFTNYKGWSDCISYWDENPTRAINVWDLCKVWGPIADNYKASPNLAMETLAGCISSKEACRPWRMYVNGQQAVYLSSQGLSLQQDTYEELTPEWLYAATKPAAPVLKPQNIYDYAFHMGTLCSGGTQPPNWRLSVPKIVGGLYWGNGLADDLDRYFRRGKVFKPGTRLTDATPDMMRDEYRHDAHRGEHRDPPTPKEKPAPRLKPQSLYGYAFKVGTLCSMGTVPPNWKPLIPKLTSGPINGAGLGNAMDEHYKAGTLCKAGTQLSDLIINTSTSVLRVLGEYKSRPRAISEVRGEQ